MDKTLIEYIDYWLKTFKRKSVKESTYDRLITSIEAIKKYDIANKKIEDITAIDIQQYVNQLADDYAYTGILKMMRIATAPLKKAAALHHIQADPSIGIELPRKEYVAKSSRNNEAYTPEEQTRLKQVLETRQTSTHYIILFMIETGLRIGEALALEWNDVDFEKGSVNVHKTIARLANKKESKVMESAKTYNSNRIIPLSKAAYSLLKSLEQHKKSSWIFADKYGERISYEAVRYRTKQICEKANVPYKGEHVFRHTFATNMYFNDVDIKILSSILGHASTSITYDTYVDLYGNKFEAMKNALSYEKTIEDKKE